MSFDVKFSQKSGRSVNPRKYSDHFWQTNDVQQRATPAAQTSPLKSESERILRTSVKMAVETQTTSGPGLQNKMNNTANRCWHLAERFCFALWFQITLSFILELYIVLILI